MFKILVAEDNDSYRQYLTAILKNEGYEPTPAKDGEDALSKLANEKFSLVVLDLMMPKKDGFETLEEIRSFSDVPVLVVSAKYLPEDKRKAFLIGTDDYLVKPIDEQEMFLRIKALLRRANVESEKQLVIGSTTLDYDSLSVKCGSTQLVLPKMEFALLYKLVANMGKSFTRYQLLDELWGFDAESEESTVSVHINRLRSKLGFINDFEIVTVWGIGYKAEKKQ